MSPTSRLVVLLLVFLFLLSSLVWAQSSATSLRGTVSDKTGATVSNAKVLLSSSERAIERLMDGRQEILELLGLNGLGSGVADGHVAPVAGPPPFPNQLGFHMHGVSHRTTP